MSFVLTGGWYAMKWMLLGVFGVLLAWSLWAWALMPERTIEGVTGLILMADDQPARRATVALFNELNPDLHVTLDPTNTGLGKVIVQCKGGIGPDLFTSFGRWQFVDYVRTGVMLPLNEYAEEYGFGLDKTWPCVADEISEIVIDPETGEKKRIQYSFPANVNANVIFFNKRIFDEESIPHPKGEWTWQEFLEVARKVRVINENGKVERYALQAFEFPECTELLWQFGAGYFDETLTYCTLDSPEAIEAMTFLHQMTFKEKIMPTMDDLLALATQGGPGGAAVNLFGQERMAMLRLGRWALVNLRQYPKIKGNIGAVQLPHYRHKVGLVRAMSVAVNPNAPNIDKALRYLQFLASDRFSELVVETGDALPPSPEVTQSDRFINDPAHPEEDFNPEFIKAVERGRNQRICPFITIALVERTFIRDVAALGKNPSPDAAEKMCRSYTDEINGYIKANLVRYASMREEYKRRTGREFDPDNFPPKDQR
jgi:multiple sugar transport system substrate-binding protein